MGLNVAETLSFILLFYDNLLSSSCKYSLSAGMLFGLDFFDLRLPRDFRDEALPASLLRPPTEDVSLATSLLVVSDSFVSCDFYTAFLKAVVRCFWD